MTWAKPFGTGRCITIAGTLALVTIAGTACNSEPKAGEVVSVSPIGSGRAIVTRVAVGSQHRVYVELFSRRTGVVWRRLTTMLTTIGSRDFAGDPRLAIGKTGVLLRQLDAHSQLRSTLLRLKDGVVLWTHQSFGDKAHGSAPDQAWNRRLAPIHHAGTFYDFINADTDSIVLIARDEATGHERWRRLWSNGQIRLAQQIGNLLVIEQSLFSLDRLRNGDNLASLFIVDLTNGRDMFTVDFRGNACVAGSDVWFERHDKLSRIRLPSLEVETLEFPSHLARGSLLTTGQCGLRNREAIIAVHRIPDSGPKIAALWAINVKTGTFRWELPLGDVRFARQGALFPFGRTSLSGMLPRFVPLALITDVSRQEMSSLAVVDLDSPDIANYIALRGDMAPKVLHRVDDAVLSIHQASNTIVSFDGTSPQPRAATTGELDLSADPDGKLLWSADHPGVVIDVATLQPSSPRINMTPQPTMLTQSVWGENLPKSH